MFNKLDSPLLDKLQMIRQKAQESENGERCMVAPSPELREKIQKELARVTKQATKRGILANRLCSQQRTPIGMNDGLIYPGSLFPIGTPPEVVRSAAANRAPLTGTLRVIVVLVDFNDAPIIQTQQHFEELFFSQGQLANGSVREYFADVTNNIVDIQGEVVGPYRMPRTLEDYANGASGTGPSSPNARTMARDAATASNPDVDFGPYDNDGDGFVDAFIVVHAGAGAEQTGSTDDIWSHKWVLPGGAFNADGTSIYAYLTVPEDARIGVCCHELGHLLFGFPDLYDIDDSSEGVGNWCLMGGGSWNGGGDIPAPPSAWCKANQGWVTVNAPTSNIIGASIPDVKDSHMVYRLWKDGLSGSEYFLVENRQQTGYDAHIPGDGLLIWHIDESIANNSDETHYKVGLEQADGNRDLENGSNRGDNSDSYPGNNNNLIFDNHSTPNSRSYAGVDTQVAVKNIGASGPVMQADLLVRHGKDLLKDFKDVKDGRKDKLEKEKEFQKEIKDLIKDNKEKEVKEKEFGKDKFEKDKPEKEWFEGKTQLGDKTDKPITDKSIELDKPGEKLTDGGGFNLPGSSQEQTDLAARLKAVELRLAAIQPFIDASLRPDLSKGALAAEEDLSAIQGDMQQNAARAKRQFDTKPSDR